MFLSCIIIKKDRLLELAKILNVNVICIREYELLELGKKSLPYVFELSRTIILATFLYSKYVVCFTD